MRNTRKLSPALGLSREVLERPMCDLRVDLHPEERQHAAAI